MKKKYIYLSLTPSVIENSIDALNRNQEKDFFFPKLKISNCQLSTTGNGHFTEQYFFFFLSNLFVHIHPLLLDAIVMGAAHNM